MRHPDQVPVRRGLRNPFQRQRLHGIARPSSDHQQGLRRCLSTFGQLAVVAGCVVRSAGQVTVPIQAFGPQGLTSVRPSAGTPVGPRLESLAQTLIREEDSALQPGAPACSCPASRRRPEPGPIPRSEKSVCMKSLGGQRFRIPGRSSRWIARSNSPHTTG